MDAQHSQQRQWANPSEYFDDFPLTEKEAAKGSALRVVCARWSGVGALNRMVSWTVLHLTSDRPKNDRPALRLEGTSIRFAKKMRQLASGYQAFMVKTPEGLFRQWYLGEAEVILPVEAKWFSLSCEKTVTAMTYRMCRRMLASHFEEIANASADREGYEAWFLQHRGTYDLKPIDEGPLMSIVMPAYRTPPDFLREAIDSVINQLYARWELVIVNASPDDEGVASVLASFDDERIVVVDCPENDGIVGNTNVGISAAHGDYISFLDHDDFVEPEALLFYVQAIQDAQKRGKRVDLLYCDEDSFDENERYCYPFFKPDFNLDLLLSNNYVIHWLTVSRHVIETQGLSNKDVEGAQDFDMSLKACLCDGEVVHIPHVMYHWRIHSGSVNANPKSKSYAIRAGQNAVKAYLDARKLTSRVTPETFPFTYRALCLPQTWPSIACFVEQGEIPSAILEAAKDYRLAGGEIDVIALEERSVAARNSAIASAHADVVAFVPADIRRLSEGFFSTAAGYFARDEVAGVSPRIMRVDGLNHYANATICPDGNLTLLSHLLPHDDFGYLGRPERPHDASVLYGPAVFFRTSALKDLGLFDESYDTVCYATADACLTLNEGGHVCVYSPFAELTHATFSTQFGHQMAACSLDDQARIVAKRGHLFAQGDPSYTINLDGHDPYYRAYSSKAQPCAQVDHHE